MTVGPVPHVAKPRRTPSRLVQKRILWPPSWDMANCYVMVSHPATSELVNRVDFATSALASAIHNTGHCHVRLGPVCLAPSCSRPGQPWQLRRSVLEPAKRHLRALAQRVEYACK